MLRFFNLIEGDIIWIYHISFLPKIVGIAIIKMKLVIPVISRS